METDLTKLIDELTTAREGLLSKRQAALDTVQTIDEALARMAGGEMPPAALLAQTPPNGVAPKRRGRPPKNPVTTPANGAPADTGHSPRAFVEDYLKKKPDSSLDDISTVAAAIGINRKAIYSTLFYLKGKGLIAAKGDRGKATYRLSAAATKK